MANWNPIDISINFALLAGVRTPGLLEVIGASRPRQYDILVPHAFNGGFLHYRGVRLAHFTLAIHLYSPKDWDDWAEFRATALIDPTIAKPRHMDIIHPILAQVGIYRLVVEEINAPTQVDDGEWVINLQCIESRQNVNQSIVKASQSEPAQGDSWDEYAKEAEAERAKAEAEFHQLAADPGNPP